MNHLGQISILITDEGSVKSWIRLYAISTEVVVSNCEFVTFPLVSWVKCGT